MLLVLPEPPPELAVEHGLFSVRQALAAGYTAADVQRNLRRSRWTLVDRGVVLAADREPDELDPLLLAVLVAGPSAVVVGRSAARLRTWDLLVDPRVPEIAVPDIPRRRKNFPVQPRLVRRDLGADDVELVGLLRLTTAARTAADLAGELPPIEAVVAVDSALRAGAIDQDALAAELRSRSRMRGRPAQSGCL